MYQFVSSTNQMTTVRCADWMLDEMKGQWKTPKRKAGAKSKPEPTPKKSRLRQITDDTLKGIKEGFDKPKCDVFVEKVIAVAESAAKQGMDSLNYDSSYNFFYRASIYIVTVGRFNVSFTEKEKEYVKSELLDKESITMTSDKISW